jgi:hypothetical protein
VWLNCPVPVGRSHADGRGKLSDLRRAAVEQEPARGSEPFVARVGGEAFGRVVFGVEGHELVAHLLVRVRRQQAVHALQVVHEQRAGVVARAVEEEQQDGRAAQARERRSPAARDGPLAFELMEREAARLRAREVAVHVRRLLPVRVVLPVLLAPVTGQCRGEDQQRQRRHADQEVALRAQRKPRWWSE